MTKDEAIATIAGVLQDLDDDDVETVASVLYRAVDRANVNKIYIERKPGMGGSGWRQGVIDELHKIDFPR